MIEVKYNNKVHSFSSGVIGSQIKEALGAIQCLGFADVESKQVFDLSTQIQGPVQLKLLDKNSPESLEILRSSLALVLASVVGGQLVEIQLTEDGFTAKFLTDSSISELDFPKIKDQMLKIIKENAPFRKSVFSYEESMEMLENGNCCKFGQNCCTLGLDKEGPNDWCIFKEVAIVTQLPFLGTAGECGPNFEIRKVAQEDFCQEKVQKLTVSAFFSAEDLAKFLDHLELLKKYDHRLIGQQLELFHTIPEAAGSAFWLPKGYKLFRSLENFIRRVAYKDYLEVRTPFVMSSCFWERSGHMKAYRANMMHITMGEEEKENAELKPMNCPGHIEVFKQRVRSYKELPLRIAEIGVCHRYEPSGSLHGLMRVRSFTMDDGHIFCAKEHIKSEVGKFMKAALETYKYFKFDKVKIQISTRPENFLGEIENWNYAEKMLQEALDEIGLEYIIGHGEGAFYGPKVEMHVQDSMGRSWQMGTIQLDFVLPERFDLSYINADGEKERPFMLHRALIGSFERFIAVLLEHTGGHLPLEFAPVQAAVCTVISEVNDYAEIVAKKLEALGIRIELDTRSHTLGYKIREHRVSKIPMIVILGKNEMENGEITLEYADKKFTYSLDKIEKIKEHFTYEN